MINKNKLFKIVSIIIVFIIFIINIYIPSKKTMASVPNKPSFTISNVVCNPAEAKVGEDITVRGKITPNDFEILVPAKEIVLVLDVSGSMDGTRINNLKSAAKEFITKLKDVPNLKIGIVAYSSLAWINPNGKIGDKSTSSIDSDSHKVPNYISVDSNLLSIKDSRLPTMIDSLQALGGTNTGEGMRKAIAMLDNGVSTANKTIILMSDGIPTFYSVNNNREFYTNVSIDDSPRYAGSGSSDRDGKCLNYAITIGNLIKEKKYNAYSIGYDMSADGNAKMSRIHSAMTGKNMSDISTTNEAKGFFLTSSGAIDSVFQTIADKIINSYNITNVNFINNMTDGFSLDIGGNNIQISDILYTKDDNNSNTNNIRYHAEPYEFTFKIKASKTGQFNNVFKNSTVSFPWNGENISVIMPSTPITIIDNSLPNINAELVGDIRRDININTNTEIEYSIIGEDFQYTDDMNQLLPKDVIILFDTSTAMDSNKIQQFKNGGFNKLLSNTTLQTYKTKYCIITYNKEAVIQDPTQDPNFNNHKGDTDTANLTSNTNSLNDCVIKNLSTSTSTELNIGQALKKANDVFNEETLEVNKYIIVVSAGQVNYSDEDIAELKEKNCRILSLAVGSDNSDIPRNFSYNLHKELAGEESASVYSSSNIKGDYFISNGSESNNDINNSLMDKIASKIVNNGDRQSYIFKDVYLNFDLGNDFGCISGLENIEGSKYRIKVPQIVYKYSSNTQKYIFQPINNIKFTVRPAQRINIELSFNDENTVTYTGIKNHVEKNILTPIIKLKADEIKHGAYKGINNISKLPDIDENNICVPLGAAITMGAYFKIYEDTPVKLTIDPRLTLINNISVYKVEENGSLTKLPSDINYSNIISFNCNSSEEKNILIVYSVKLPDIDNDIKIYTNTVDINNGNLRDAKINASNIKQPDLF